MTDNGLRRHRIALKVRYDGTDFMGWQSQPGLPTVQYFVDRAISAVANHTVTSVCAGRTDRGVHATGQIVHFDTTAQRDPASWLMGITSNLPRRISISWADEVPMEFHARFKAIERTYCYVIYNNRVRPGIMRHHVTWHNQLLDEKKMQQALDFLLGEHDFNAFRSSKCQSKVSIRCLHKAKIIRHNDLIITTISGNSFLHHMIRNIMGVLIPIGVGDKPPSWAKYVLESQDRTQAGMTARPDGLYLTNISYPIEFSIPTSADQPFFLL